MTYQINEIRKESIDDTNGRYVVVVKVAIEGKEFPDNKVLIIDGDDFSQLSQIVDPDERQSAILDRIDTMINDLYNNVSSNALPPAVVETIFKSEDSTDVGTIENEPTIPS